MNQKIEIWKRKLAKEKWKNQKAVWEKLSQEYEPKDPDWPDMTDMINHMTTDIDIETRFSIKSFIDNYFNTLDDK